MIWLESPSNIGCQIADIDRWSRLAAERGALCVVDNTLAPAPLQVIMKEFPFVTLIVCSLTKFHGGHSDLLGGVIVTRSQSLADELRKQRSLLGSVMGSLECWLLLRSLSTFELRISRQSESALVLVKYISVYLSGKDTGDTFPPRPCTDEVKVLHSSLSQMSQSLKNHTPVFFLQFRTLSTAKLFVSNLNMFSQCTSFGGVASSVDLRSLHDTTVDPGLVRVSVGVEDVKNLAWDIYEALQKCSKRSLL